MLFKAISNLLYDFNMRPTIYEVAAPAVRPSDAVREIDTFIVGAGLAGLSTALELACAGQSVVVADRKKIGDEASGRSGGQLWPGFEMPFSEMREAFGLEKTQSVWSMVHESMAKVHQRAATRSDNCDFKPGVLLTAKTQPQSSWLQAEARTLNAAGYEWAKYIGPKGLRSHLNSTVYRDAILYTGDQPRAQYGHLNPLRYTQQVALMARTAGATIIEENAVTSINRQDDGRYRVQTEKGTYHARTVVMAAGANMARPQGVDFNRVPRYHVRAQTLILATEPMPSAVAREIMPSAACFADASSTGMNYGRFIPAEDGSDRERLLFGGADALGQVQMAFEAARLEKQMHTVFPALKEMQIKPECIWGGVGDLTRNGLPVLTEPYPDFYFVSGFCGQGMVNTALYGSAIADKIVGQTSRRFDELATLTPPAYSSNIAVANMQALYGIMPEIVADWKTARKEAQQARQQLS